MVKFKLGGTCKNSIRLMDADSDFTAVQDYFHADYLSSFPLVRASEFDLYIGLGSAGQLTGRRLIDAAAKAVKMLKEYHVDQAVVDLSFNFKKFGINCIRFVVLGIKLGLYQYGNYCTDFQEESDTFFLTGVEDSLLPAAKTLLAESENLADGILQARDMVNTPANCMTPDDFATALRCGAQECGVQAEILDEKQVEALGMNAFLTVGSSSGNSPRLIVLRYLADPENPVKTALVGKGVTCDTGGYCLKGKNSMLGIKGDMAGGAAVAQAIFALAKNKVNTNVVGIIPACENRISRQSFVPGDIITSMSGKTIEIQNTDAEGRLILADAVTYAVRVEKATRILDIATLTGAVVNTLGFTTAGVLTNDEHLWSELQAAAQASQEQYWRLPIYPEYEDLIASKIADIKNMGASYCGTISAGLFIKAFCEDLPWLHLDIAGTAWVDQPVFEHQSIGATGAAVATLYDLFHKPLQC